MEDQELFKSFLFRLYTFAPKHHTNNLHGVARHYIGYLYRGSAKLVSDEETLELEEGDLFYIPKGCRYHSYWYGKDGAQFDSFSFAAIPEQAHTGYCLQKLNMTDEVRRLHRELAQDRTVNVRSVGLLYRLLWELMPTMKQRPYGKNDALARKIANHIYEHPDERSDLTARSCGVSESTMYHVLKNVMNKTPNQLRQEARCTRAINLLTSTDLSIEQVSIQLGFSSSSYMRKLLRATTGKTPLQIRKSTQNSNI